MCVFINVTFSIRFLFFQVTGGALNIVYRSALFIVILKETNIFVDFFVLIGGFQKSKNWHYLQCRIFNWTDRFRIVLTFIEYKYIWKVLHRKCQRYRNVPSLNILQGGEDGVIEIPEEVLDEVMETGSNG